MNEIEIAVLDFLQNVIKGDILDFVMPKITALGNAGILWIILTLIFLISKKQIHLSPKKPVYTKNK